MPCLVWDSPQGRQVFDLDRAMLILGRDEVADVQILEKSVSRRHAIVQIENGTVKVTDLGSRSGTRINGAKLVPDLPSSLDPGDFVQLGRVTMTYHVNPPPLKKPPPPAARPAVKAAPAAATRRRPAAAPPPPSGDRWKLLAIGFAFVAVAGIGAIIALVATRDDEPPAQPPVAEVEEPAPKEEPTPEPMPEPEVKKETPPKVDENLAPDGELPPRGFLSPRDYPDLIEFNYTEYYPVRLLTWDGSRVKAVGGDGRTYAIPQSRVTKGENRVDLASRAARARTQLDPEDAEAHLELARWCARRYIRTETRALAKKVLELRPNDPEATQLLRSTE